jgi:hypothetical protein
VIIEPGLGPPLSDTGSIIKATATNPAAMPAFHPQANHAAIRLQTLKG